VKVISVYDGYTRKRLAFLQNAFNIKYEKNINSVWTASFSMPYSDSKNQYCESFNLIDIWDIDASNNNKYVGLFRIMPKLESSIRINSTIEYTLEHVITTLIDDVMIGWHEIGNNEISTSKVIAYILENQSTKKWVLDICDYEYEYLYGWQDENLLSALYSVVQPFSDTDYYWDFDTTIFPWCLKLLKTNKTPVTDIRYKKNIFGIKKTEDPTNLTTRLYCYGYGEGDNKLGITNVNNGIPYLDSINISKYGVITQVWTDESITIEETLKAMGESMLKKLEEPVITYEIDIKTVSDTLNLTVGDTVRVVNGLLDEYMVVQKITKDDVSGASQDGTIILGTGTVDISNSLADIAERQRISETYSQGSESIFTDSFYDNADDTNPAEISFIIPENAVHVNEIRFSAKLKNFRAYSKAIQGGGADSVTTSDGGSDNVTSSSGGSSEITSEGGGVSTITSSSGGGCIAISESNTTETSTSSVKESETVTSVAYTIPDDGGDAIWKTSGGNSSLRPIRSTDLSGASHTHDVTVPFNSHTHSYARSDNELTYTGTTSSHNHSYYKTSQVVMSTGSGSGSSQKVTSKSTTIYLGEHTHGIALHYHRNTHSHEVTIPSHSHTVTIPGHTHYVPISSHQHSVDTPVHTHLVTIPNHTHSVSIPSHTHSVTLPNHVHNIKYGIYKGPIASSMSIYLDNNLIGDYTGNVSNINLIPYMSKNANGDIMRGEHTISITPNSLTRIEVTFQIRMFTNSHGGSQY